MKHKAKCNLCGSILEFIEDNYNLCKCGEIYLDGFSKTVICNKSSQNYCELDEEGNPIIIGKDDKPKKDELLKLLDDMARTIEDLPPAAMTAAITHYDLWSLIVLLSSILRAED